MPQFLVNQTIQTAIEAESQKEAVTKVLNGEGNQVSFSTSATARPQPRPTQTPPGTPMRPA